MSESRVDQLVLPQSTTAEFVAQLRSLGVKLWTEVDQLRLSAPKGSLSDEMKRDPSRLDVYEDYVRNIARWLGTRGDLDLDAREHADVRAPRSPSLADG